MDKVKGSDFSQKPKSNASNIQKEVKSLQETITSNDSKNPALSQNVKKSNNASINEITKIKQQYDNNKHLLEELDKKIEKLAHTVSKERIGEQITIDTHILKIEKKLLEANHFYESMRNTNKDIHSIVKNTGISEEIITKIKQHVFFEEHILADGIKRFWPQVDMAAAWQRLTDGNFVYSDLLLLQHEYAEALIMNGMEIAYGPAHAFVNKLYNWNDTL